jgi:hypothetical protein
VAVLDSTASAVPLPGQDNQTADTRAHSAVARPGLPDPVTPLVREGRFLRAESARCSQPAILSARATGGRRPPGDPTVLKDHVLGARTDANAGGRVPSTLALRCTKAASAVTADTILEDIYARI